MRAFETKEEAKEFWGEKRPEDCIFHNHDAPNSIAAGSSGGGGGGE